MAPAILQAPTGKLLRFGGQNKETGYSSQIKQDKTGRLYVFSGGKTGEAGFDFVRNYDYDNNIICISCFNVDAKKYFYTYNLGSDTWSSQYPDTSNILSAYRGFFCLGGNIFISYVGTGGLGSTIKKYSFPVLGLIGEITNPKIHSAIDENRVKFFLNGYPTPPTGFYARRYADDFTLEKEVLKGSWPGKDNAIAADDTYTYFFYFDGYPFVSNPVFLQCDLDFNNVSSVTGWDSCFAAADNGRVFFLTSGGTLYSFNQSLGDEKLLGETYQYGKGEYRGGILSIGLTKDYISFISLDQQTIQVYDWTHTFVKEISLPT